MSKDIESVIAKISKLLAMAEHENSNPNEAARAASMAAKMMTEYQVEREDVIRAELESGGGVTDSPISDKEYKAWPSWLQTLAVKTAQLFECEVQFERGSTGKKFIKIMGYEADVMMVKWMYEYLYEDLSRQATRAMNESISGAHGSTVKKSFLAGAVNTLATRFEEIIAERLKDYASSGTGLMVIKNDAIKDKYGLVKYKKTKTRTKADYDAYASGQKAGENVNINRPLGQGEKQKALGN